MGIIWLWRRLRSTRIVYRSPDSRLRGPRQWPLIGSGAVLKKPNPHLHLQLMIREYGRVFKLKMMGRHWVVISDHDIIQEALVKKGKDFASRPDIFYKSNNERGKSIHHAIVRAIRGMLSTSYDNNIHNLNATSTFIKKLHEKDGTAFNPRLVIEDFNYSVLTNILLGDCSTGQVGNIRKVSHLINYLRQPSTFTILTYKFSWLRYFNNKAKLNSDKLQELLSNIYDACKPNVMSEINTEELTSMVESVVKGIRSKGQTVDVGYIKQFISTVALGGSDTTSTFLYRMLCILAHYPEIQSKIYQEVMVATREGKPEIKHLDACPYTTACIMEILRNTKAGFVETPHMAVRDSTLDGFDIPKGTVILLNTWATHHDAAFWSEPYRYKPERFLDEAGQLLSAEHPARRRALPFNTGALMCPGRVFAKTRMFLGVAAVLQEFTIKPENEVKPEIVDPRIFLPNTSIKVRFCSRLANN